MSKSKEIGKIEILSETENEDGTITLDVEMSEDVEQMLTELAESMGTDVSGAFNHILKLQLDREEKEAEDEAEHSDDTDQTGGSDCTCGDTGGCCEGK